MACGYDECGMDCVPGCGGCAGTCTYGCSGCSGCGGCGGCGGACSSGCSGSCDNTCTACTGSCQGYCDNGCTATNMSSFYTSLGANIVVGSVIKTVDINDIISALNQESSRRGYSIISSVNSNKTILNTTRNMIRSQLITMGLSSSTAQYDVCKASEMQDYITYIKTLYEQKVRS